MLKHAAQYELVFSKWPTMVKISRGFLARSAGNSDSKKLKKVHAARKMDAGADDKPGYFFTWPNQSNHTIFCCSLWINFALKSQEMVDGLYTKSWVTS